MDASRSKGKGSASSVSDRMFLFLLTLPILLLFLLTQADALSPAHDSIAYLRQIGRGEYFHAHHLLYNAIAALWTGGWQVLIPSLETVTLIAWLNGVFGAMSMCVFAMLLLHRVGVGRKFTVAATLIPVFSFGVWFYSVTIEVYIIALFFMLVALYILTCETLTRRMLITAALFHGMSMLFHQLHLFFLIPAIVLIVFAQYRRSGERLPAWKPALLYTAVAGFASLLPYLAVGIGVLGMNTPQSYMQWLLGYGTRGVFWQEPGFSLLPKVALGFGRSVIGGDFFFALQPTLDLIQSMLPSKWLADQEFTVRNMPQWLAVTLVALSGIFAAVLLSAVWKAGRGILRFRRTLPPVFIGALLVFLTYGAFFTFWDTTNVEFWIPQSVMLWLLIVIGLDARRKNATLADAEYRSGLPGLVPALAALLLVINGSGSIFWMMPASNDYYMVKTEMLLGLAGNDGVIILPDPYILDLYFPPERTHQTYSLATTLHAYDEDVSLALAHTVRVIDSAAQRAVPIVVEGDIVTPTSAMTIFGGEGFVRLVDAFLGKYSEALYPVGSPVIPMYLLDSSFGNSRPCAVKPPAAIP